MRAGALDYFGLPINVWDFVLYATQNGQMRVGLVTALHSDRAISLVALEKKGNPHRDDVVQFDDESGCYWRLMNNGKPITLLSTASVYAIGFAAGIMLPQVPERMLKIAVDKLNEA
jgi:hypothetical protein